MASGCTEKSSIVGTMLAPVTTNDEDIAKSLQRTFGYYFKDSLVDTEPVAGSEYFSILATAIAVPYLMWTYDGLYAKTWDEAIATSKTNELLGNHSPYFAPVIEPTLRTGVDAMALGALMF